MSNVVEINSAKNGDFVFMICPCKSGGTPYMVTVIAGDKPIIAGLICPECESTFAVVNGIVQPNR